MTAQTMKMAATPNLYYTARRKNEIRALMQHTIVTLFVLGALVLIVNV